MRVSNVRVLLLSALIRRERRWTSDFGTNTKPDLTIVVVETDDGLTRWRQPPTASSSGSARPTIRCCTTCRRDAWWLTKTGDAAWATSPARLCI